MNDDELYGPVPPEPKQGVFQRLTNAFRKNHASYYTQNTTSTVTTAGTGYHDDVQLYTLVRHFHHDIYFNLAVRLNADATVGHGYSFSGQESGRGQQALDVVENFADENDFDAILQRIAIDGWISGNSFLEWRDGMLKHVPQSCISYADLNMYGEITTYKVTRNGTVQDIPAKDILHFKFQCLDSSPFGTGLGQIMARRGIGYELHNGKRSRRPTQFEINEMKDDIIVKTLYAGMPRYLINVPKVDGEILKQVTGAMNKLDPLQHFVNNADITVDEMALNPSNKFADLFRSIESSTAVASMSPVSRLWQDLGFTSYASSQSAMESMLPQIDAFQRALKRFVEKQILTPLLTTNNFDPIKHKVTVTFGPEEGLTLDQIADIVSILKDTKLDGHWDPEDIIDLLRDVGVPLSYKNPDMGKSPRSIRRNMARQKAYKAQKFPSIPKTTEEMKEDILRKVRRRYR